MFSLKEAISSTPQHPNPLPDNNLEKAGGELRPIHNPVAPRRSSSQPRIYLVETYRQEVRQQPGHWLGPLSHTVTLFPGEVRRLKLSTQSMFVTKQQRTTRESGRTTFERKASVKDQ